MITVRLKPGKEASAERFHPWIFSGAIASADGQPEEGDLVEVRSASDGFIGRGHCCVGSIAVRILSFEPEPIDQAWWNARLRQAWDVRRAIGLVDSPQTTCFRWAHGEGDGLPGLVVDWYDGVAVLQAHTVGMWLAREAVCSALRTVAGDRLRAVYDKSSGTLPYKSEVDAADGYLYGAGAVDETVLEGGLSFRANWEGGQKTGFFLDQRENRALVERYARGRKVLNTFCYTGGFSVYALRGGAVRVDSVDSSARAVELAEANVRLNAPGADHRAVAADALDYVKRMEQGAYDLIVLDPPAFAKHHNVLGNALQGYKRLNANALEKIAPGGILFTFSCSQAVSKEQFRMAVFSAAAIARRRVRILHQLTQPADHPVNIYHPEGEYLKGLVLYVE